jgi:hypothetical protein
MDSFNIEERTLLNFLIEIKEAVHSTPNTFYIRTTSLPAGLALGFLLSFYSP